MDLSVQTEIVAGIVKSESKGLDFMLRKREREKSEEEEGERGKKEPWVVFVVENQIKS